MQLENNEKKELKKRNWQYQLKKDLNEYGITMKNLEEYRNSTIDDDKKDNEIWRLLTDEKLKFKIDTSYELQCEDFRCANFNLNQF